MEDIEDMKRELLEQGRPIGEIANNPEQVISTHSLPDTTDEARQERRRLVTKRDYRKSKYEQVLDKRLRALADSPKLGTFVNSLLDDPLVASIQNYGNVVAIQRLGYNDHGPVHARIVALNCLRILELLEKGGVYPNIVSEDLGDMDDARVVVFGASFLHDLGMAVTRDDHEHHSIHIADRFLDRHLARVYDDEGSIWMIKCMINEGIIGHMGHYRIHSIEAGIVMVGDGADCTRGRAMIPTILAKNPMIGDIHRFSASAIETVNIGPGQRKPVRIDVHMTSSAGLFQVEEVLLGKAKMSPLMNYLEIAAHLDGKERLYLQ